VGAKEIKKFPKRFSTKKKKEKFPMLPGEYHEKKKASFGHYFKKKKAH